MISSYVIKVRTGMIINSKQQLKKIIKELKESGQNTIAVVPGTYRYPHVGHIFILKKAYEKVAPKNGVVFALVNSTDSIASIKPKTDFIFEDENRKALIDLLPYVHYTVMFDQDTPEELCKIIQPTFLIKGDDWKDKKLPEAKYCKNVVFVKRIKRTNAKKMVELIRGKTK